VRPQEDLKRATKLERPRKNRTLWAKTPGPSSGKNQKREALLRNLAHKRRKGKAFLRRRKRGKKAARAVAAAPEKAGHGTIRRGAYGQKSHREEHLAKGAFGTSRSLDPPPRGYPECGAGNLKNEIRGEAETV